MASKLSSEHLKFLCECAVCFEPYKDPRLLVCGHHFCQKCLEDIADRHAKGELPCPICNTVTKPKLGAVTSLPRSTQFASLQELIFQPPTEEALGKVCTKCQTNKPTCHCRECKPELSFMCDECFEVHQKVPRYAKHETVPYDPMLVCSTHTQKMVECYCHTCTKVVCDECQCEGHAEHNTENIVAAAEECEKQIQETVTMVAKNMIDINIIIQLENSSSKLESQRKTYENKADKIKQVITKLQQKLDSRVKHINTLVDNEQKKIEEEKSRISAAASEQVNVREVGCSLLEGATDLQLIKGCNELTNPDPCITNVTVQVPIISSQLDELIDSVERLSSAVEYTVDKKVYELRYREEVSMGYPLETADIHVTHGVCGLALDKHGSDSGKVVVKTKGMTGPINVYTRSGTLVKSVGQEICGVYTGWHTGCIAVDTVRDLYLLPMNNGLFVRTDRDGKIRDKSKLSTDLWGVTHCTDTDMYYVTDRLAMQILVVSPTTLSITRCISGKEHLNYPVSVCTGVINSVPAVVVSDTGNSTVQVYNRDSGALIRKCGPSTASHLGPLSVAVDGSGRIVVCDHDNTRVLRVTVDTDNDMWECLLTDTDLGGKPVHVDIDNRARVMAVSVKQGSTNYVRMFTL